MIRAVKQDPSVLTFATNGLDQDRTLLKAAALNMEEYLGNSTGSRNEWIVESVKFGLYAEASDFSTKTHLRIKSTPFLTEFNVHNEAEHILY